MTDKLEEAYAYLIDAIASGDGSHELIYSTVEQVTVGPLLQERIAQDEQVEVRAIDYAYYLLIHHYKDFARAGAPLEKSRSDYLKEYEAGVTARMDQPEKGRQDGLALYLLDSLLIHPNRC